MQKFTLLQADLERWGVVDFGYTEELRASSFDRFKAWVEAGLYGPLRYLSGERALKRLDLRSVYPDCQSALVFLFTYHQQKMFNDLFYTSADSNGLKVAAYALGFEGKDYHHVLRNRLVEIAESLGGVAYRIAIDTSPILEKDLAYRAGLGWVGKNSLLLSPKHGSTFMIGTLLLGQKLSGVEKRVPELDHCGSCNACVNVCPTSAIHPTDRTLFVDRCISTYTIEMFQPTSAPKGFEVGLAEVFGCDLCQDVCPWNQRLTGRPFGTSLEFLMKKNKEEIVKELDSMSNRGFRRRFQGTVLERLGRIGLLKNLRDISS